MKLNQTQKDLLKGILENAISELDFPENMEFGEDFRIISLQVDALKPIDCSCAKCGKDYLLEELNELEAEEYDSRGEFVCTDCIQKEMKNE